MQTNVCTADV